MHWAGRKRRQAWVDNNLKIILGSCNLCDSLWGICKILLARVLEAVVSAGFLYSEFQHLYFPCEYREWTDWHKLPWCAPFQKNENITACTYIYHWGAVEEMNIFFAQLSKLNYDDNTTGGFLPLILLRGFYSQPAPRLKHNTLRGFFTIKTTTVPYTTICIYTEYVKGRICTSCLQREAGFFSY
jgi:hypothetical protein